MQCIDLHCSTGTAGLSIGTLSPPSLLNTISRNATRASHLRRFIAPLNLRRVGCRYRRRAPSCSVTYYYFTRFNGATASQCSEGCPWVRRRKKNDSLPLRDIFLSGLGARYIQKLHLPTWPSSGSQTTVTQRNSNAIWTWSARSKRYPACI